MRTMSTEYWSEFGYIDIDELEAIQIELKQADRQERQQREEDFDDE